jgi:Molecular chaperone, HSP90 family
LYVHSVLISILLTPLSRVLSFRLHIDLALAEEVAADTADTAVNTSSGEPYKFQAEVSRVLDIVVNSLYQNKDVFLRELISNASDALDKIRFLSITKPELLQGKTELEIRISYNKEDKTLTITDSGIGMTKDDLVNNLGTVARSGTTKFMEALQEGAADISQIGMFGVGFYSAFLVADKVSVATKHPQSDKQYVWSSVNGQDTFFIDEDPRGNTLGRGTEITLHLKDDAEQYAEFNKLDQLVHHYSEFVTHPIFVRKTETVQVPDEEDEMEEEKDEADSELDVSDEEDADAADEEKPKKMKDVTTHSWVKSNADAAIWNRPKEEILDDEYQEFYKLINKDAYGQNATSWSHFDAEGNINFKSLVYMPSNVPNQLLSGDLNNFKSSMKLYVRKVLISDDFELLPKYMSFITGVVDSDDLPLNVNRETLQESKIIAIIRKKVTRKVIDMIQKFADSPMPEKESSEDEVEIDEEGNIIEKDDAVTEEKEHPYLEWYTKFQPSIKMGVVEDEANRKRLAKLIRIKTSKSDGKWVSFQDYVENMKDWQKEIYFIAGHDEKELQKSPFMEKFNEKDLEVIYFTEPADEYMIGHLREYDGKKFTTITHENIEFGDEDEDLKRRRSEAYKEKFGPLVKFMNKFYSRAITKVKISSRLGNSPAIVSSSEYGQSANMERIMRAQAFAHGQDAGMMPSMKTLEINPRHPFFEALLEKIPDEDDEDAKPSLEVRDALWTLLDTALLNGGYHINEGKAFTGRMMRFIKQNLGTDNFDLLPEIDPKVEEDVPPEVEMGDGINMEDFAEDDLDEFSD